jgi:outer membrane protein assembly factor BamB
LICFSGSVLGQWETYHGGADLRGVSDAAVPEKPVLLWRYNAGGAVYSTPVSDGTRIFFAAKKGQVVALDFSGAEIWKKTFTRTNDAGTVMPLKFEAPLCTADGVVFAGSSLGSLMALDAETGAEKWRYETGGVFVGSPNVVLCGKDMDREAAKTRRKGGLVLILDQAEGALHAVDIQSGKRRWKTEGVERCDGSPGAGGGRVVFGSCLSALHLFSTEDGSHLRDIEVGDNSQVAGGVAIFDELLFAGTRGGDLICANAVSGELVWRSSESAEQTFSTPAVTSNTVIYTSDDGFVYAVNRADGKTIWKFDTGGLPNSPVVAQARVAVAADGVLYLLDLMSGRKLWSKEVSDEISSPALIGGMILVGADDGTVSAFGEMK